MQVLILIFAITFMPFEVIAQNNFIKTLSHRESLVVGMGPAGLNAAINLINIGHKVHIIDKRQNPFEREQRLLLSSVYVHYLFYNVSDFPRINNKVSNVEIETDYDDEISPIKINGLTSKHKLVNSIDYDFFNYLVDCKGLVATNVLQKYLFDKMKGNVEKNYSILLKYKNASYKAKLDAILSIRGLFLCLNLLGAIENCLKRDQFNIYNNCASDFFIDKSMVDYNYCRDEEGFKNRFLKELSVKSAVIKSLTNIDRLAPGVTEKVVNQSFDMYINHIANMLNVYLNARVDYISPDYSKCIVQQEGLTRVLAIDNIVCAEGASRNVLKNINGLNVREIPLNLTRARKKVVGIIVIRVKSNEAKDWLANGNKVIVNSCSQLSSIFTKNNLSILDKFGWNKKYIPMFYIHYLKDKNKFYIASEFPQKFLKIKNREDLLKEMSLYVQEIILIEWPNFGSKDLDLQNMDDNAKVFELSLNYVKWDYLNPRYATKIFAVGDSLINTNFLSGNGLNNVSASVMGVVESFDYEGNFNNNVIYKKQLSYMIDSLNHWNAKRGY